MTLKEAMEKFAKLSDRERRTYEKVMAAVKTVGAKVDPGVTVTREMVREYMDTTSTGTISKYMSLQEALDQPAPAPDAPTDEPAGPPQLSPVVVAGFGQVTAALDKLASIIRGDTNAIVAGESERFRAALTTQKCQHDDYVQVSKEKLKAVERERDAIATEADVMATENEDLRAALDVAAQRTNSLSREVELGTVMLRNVEGQLASCESRANAARLDCVTANQRADKAEIARDEAIRLRAADGERHQASLDEALHRHQASLEEVMRRHQASLDELMQRHSAEIGEVRAAWAADVTRERDRTAVLDMAIVNALKGAVDPGSAADADAVREKEASDA